MTRSTTKSFDCVASAREIRDRISDKIAGMNHADLRRWLRSHRFKDSNLQALAEQARQDDAPPSR